MRSDATACRVARASSSKQRLPFARNLLVVSSPRPPHIHAPAPRLPRARTLPRTLSLALALTLTLTLLARPAHACGAAYPGGPVMCDFPRKDSPASSANAPSGPPIARLSASYAFTSTTILFGSARRAELTRNTIFGGVQAPLTRSGTWSLLFGAGGIASGELVHGAAHDSLGPGFSAYGGVAGRVVDGRGALPFVQLTATLSATHALTRTDDRGTRSNGSTTPGAQPETPRFSAFDLRVGAIAGKTFGDVFTPYVTARAFGGPVFWHLDGASVTGTDLYKYQLGGGVSVALFRRRLDLFAEGIPAGERGVAAGIGTTFF